MQNLKYVVQNGQANFRKLAILLLVFGLGSCGGGGGGGGSSTPVDTGNQTPRENEQLLPSTVIVDSAIVPGISELPAFEDGIPRTVSAVEDENGTVAMFVENEIWLSTNDSQVLSDFLDQWNGEVISIFDAQRYEIPNLENQYLIRVNATDADVSNLIDDLASLQSDVRGDLKLSSPAAIATLAISAEAALSGLASGINWVAEGSDFRNRDIADAPAGVSAADPNAFSWPSHAIEGSQNTGVAEAWRALDFAGLLTPNKIELAILDMGFAPSADFPEGWYAFSNIPFVGPTGSENIIGCGSSPCLWHGTNVLGAAMAVANNEFGSAGPAGPVADPIIIHTLYDFFTSITALGEAKLIGADIANMSYGAPVHITLSWSVLPFDNVTNSLRASGTMLIFAAAGNDGKNVDGEACFLGVCVESYWYTPCENSGVICVGGLNEGTRTRHENSNFGAEHVDIFAPFVHFLGPDPENPGNSTRRSYGTSYSAPFAAGIAALIMAADDELTVGEVESILFDTAHSSSDSQVNRTVNAYDAVVMALGNVPPNINVRTPVAESTRPLNTPVDFRAETDDFEDGFLCCEVSWRSDVDGELGQGDVVYNFSSTGSRTITASTMDSNGLESEINFTLEITNNLPSVSITQPESSIDLYRGVSVLLRGTSFDINETDNRLDCDGMQWFSSNPADNLPIDCEITVQFNSNGIRTITLVGTDSEGETAEDEVTINVIDPPVDLPPAVQIDSLINGSNINVFDTHLLSAIVSDAEDELADLEMTWSVVWSNAGSGTAEIGTGQSLNWSPTDSIDFNDEGTWVMDVTLSVRDSSNNVASDTVRVQTILIN